MLDLLIIILIIAWLGGFSLHIAGSLIHLLLIIALLCVAYRIITGRSI